jgi:hypothetical protein
MSQYEDPRCRRSVYGPFMFNYKFGEYKPDPLKEQSEHDIELKK